VIFNISANLQSNQSNKVSTISGPCSTRELGVCRLRIALNKPPNSDVTSDCFEKAVRVERLNPEIRSWPGG